MSTKDSFPGESLSQHQLARTSTEHIVDAQQVKTGEVCTNHTEAGCLCVFPAPRSPQIAESTDEGNAGTDAQRKPMDTERESAQIREKCATTSKGSLRSGTLFSTTTGKSDPPKQRGSGKASSTQDRCLSLKRRCTSFFNNWWYWEIISILFIGLLLLATITLLICIEGMSLSTWRFKYIQPSTMISIFMTLSKSASMVVITECIGQAKWLDFTRRSRRLSWFQEYDEATRGPLGSLLILQRIGKISWLAIAGALLTILALGVEAFAQQVVQYQTRLVSLQGDAATLSVTQDLDYINKITMQGSILDGVYLNSQPSDVYKCTTGNCEWPVPVVTLGVCGRCTDVTSSQSPTCTPTPGPLEPSLTDIDVWSFESIKCNYTVNANISLPIYIQTLSFPPRDGRPEEYASQWTRFKMTTPGLEKGLGDHIGGEERWIATTLSYATLYSQDTSPLPQMTVEILKPHLFACGLYWCAQVYDSPVVVNGTAPTQEPSAKFRLVAPVGRDGDVSVETEVGASNVLQVPDSSLAGYPAEASRNFTVDQDTHLKLTDYLEQLFNVTRNAGNDAFSVFPDINSELTGFTDAVFSSSSSPNTSNSGNAGSNPADPTATFARIARAMTNQVRQSRSSYVLAGRALGDETYVAVDWRWMTLPLSVFALAVGLLIATIETSCRNITTHNSKHIWKSSALAMLLYQIQPGWELETMPPLQTTDEMDQFANGIEVQLSDETGGMRGMWLVKSNVAPQPDVQE